METIPISVKRSVLVVGGGIAGLETSLQLANRGFKVILVERENALGGILPTIATFSEINKTPAELAAEKISAVHNDANIEVLTGTKLIDLDGFAGNFSYILERSGKELTGDVGAIVVATGFQTIFCPVKYGLGIADNVMGQLKLEKMLLDRVNLKGKSISFVVGQVTEQFTLSFATALKNAVYLKEHFTSMVNIFYTNIKVCGDYLESLYTKARELGVQFYKFNDKMPIISGNGEVTVNYEDPFLQSKYPGVFKITSDYIVLPEEILPAEGTEEIAKILGLTSGPHNFLDGDNVNLLPSTTNREGIYLVGGCRWPGLVQEINVNAHAVAGEIYSKFPSDSVEAVPSQPTVEAKKCAVCLTCYRLCPHGAISIVRSNEYDNMYKAAARMDPLACRRCGICAAECPGKAIQMPGFTDDEVLARVTTALEG